MLVHQQDLQGEPEPLQAGPYLRARWRDADYGGLYASGTRNMDQEKLAENLMPVGCASVAMHNKSEPACHNVQVLLGLSRLPSDCGPAHADNHLHVAWCKQDRCNSVVDERAHASLCRYPSIGCPVSSTK